jgi:hypothetical protein
MLDTNQASSDPFTDSGNSPPKVETESATVTPLRDLADTTPRPILAKPEPKRSRKLPKQVAEYLAQNPHTSSPSGRHSSLTDGRHSSLKRSYIEDSKSYKPYVRSHESYINTKDESLYSTNYVARDLSDENRSDQQVLAEIAFAAFSRPWPGETGPTDARVLAGLLQAGQTTVKVPLDKFAHEVGLTNRTVKTALERLDEAGWGKFEVGDPDRYDSDGLEQRGKPSTFTLNPRTNPTGTYNPDELPWLLADLFSRDELGSAGWLLLARLLFEHRDERDPQPLVNTSDIVQLTGMSMRRAQRLLAKLARVGIVEDRQVTIYLLRSTTETDRSTFDCQVFYSRQDRRNDRGLRREKAQKQSTEAKQVKQAAESVPAESVPTELPAESPESIHERTIDIHGFDCTCQSCEVDDLVDRIKCRGRYALAGVA